MLLQNPGSRYTLALNGAFHPEWAASLCAGLGARRISVERGYARQVQRGIWESSFELRPLDPSVELRAIDYAALARAPRDRSAGVRPSLTGFELAHDGGALVVTLRGRDEVGFLAGLLGIFSFQMLFVHEMEVGTAGGEVRDRFVLRGFAGTAPGPKERSRLLAALESLAAGAATVDVNEKAREPRAFAPPSGAVRTG